MVLNAFYPSLINVRLELCLFTESLYLLFSEPSCVAGQHVNQLDGTCVYCSENQWSSDENNDVCQKCPSGKVVAAGKGRKESDCTWDKFNSFVVIVRVTCTMVWGYKG